MSGYVAIHRQIFESDIFAQEPFTEREAWVWLIAEAAWQDRRKRSGQAVVNLRRGQLAHSRRFMAKAWRWTDSRVYRFLEKLSADGMLKIEPLANHSTSIITICNYDKYQKDRTSNEAKIEPAANQTIRREEIIDDDDDGGGPAPLVSREAINLANEVAVVCGHDPEFVPPSWMGAAWTAQKWINGGWSAAAILAACKEAMAKKRDGPPSRIEYFEKPIAQFIARQAAPLPHVEIVKGETVHVVQGFGQQNQRGSLTDAARRLAASFAENRPGDSGATGSNIVRLLPESRRE